MNAHIIKTRNILTSFIHLSRQSVGIFCGNILRQICLSHIFYRLTVHTQQGRIYIRSRIVQISCYGNHARQRSDNHLIFLKYRLFHKLLHFVSSTSIFIILIL